MMLLSGTHDATEFLVVRYSVDPADEVTGNQSVAMRGIVLVNW
jgi:hypothetical protein